MGEDRQDYKKVRPYYTLEFDPNEKYRKQRAFSLYLILGGFGFYSLRRIWDREVKRARRTNRDASNIKDLPEYKFEKIGGVLIKKPYQSFLHYYPDMHKASATQ